MPAINLQQSGFYAMPAAAIDINLPGLGFFANGLSTDAVAPTVPDNVIATPISTTEINLTWTCSTDAVGVTGYNVYRDAVLIGTTVPCSYSDTGLTENTAYTYTVEAYDAEGNTSAASVAVVKSTRLDRANGLFRQAKTLNTEVLPAFRRGSVARAVDQITETKLVPSISEVNDYYGVAPVLNLNGDTFVASTLNYNFGALVVYRRTGNTWTEEGILENPVSSVTYFGVSNAITDDGDIIATGAYDDGTGKVYIWKRTSGVWALLQTISSPGASRFGLYVALSSDGGRLVVASRDDTYDGTLYVYNLTNGLYVYAHTLQQTQKDVTSFSFYYGQEELAISGDGNRIISGWSDVNGYQSWLFPWKYNSTTDSWTQGTVYVHPNTAEYLGEAVRLNYDGSLLVASASSVSVNGYDEVGSIFVFENTGTVLSLIQTIPKPNVDYGYAYWGYSMSMDKHGQKLVIGEGNWDTNLDGAGAWIYQRRGGTFVWVKQIRSSDLQEVDAYADQVAISGNGEYIGVGASNYDVTSTNEGKCYVYKDSI